jgi:YVTN family beta-propeller protein
MSPLLAGLLAIAATATPPPAAPRAPAADTKARTAVYVGARTCAKCHDGPEMGHQTSKWVKTKHAQAFIKLAQPASLEIASISGVPIEPQKSPLCLGCHATAADVEEADRDDTFSFREGVQCEKCHGPGSNHVDAWSSAEGRAALDARLGNPGHDDCMKCHTEKPSHTRVLGARDFDLPSALRAIAHPTPRGGKPRPDQARMSPELEEFLAHAAEPAAAPAAPTAVVRYKTPLNPTLSPDGRELYVTCEGSASVCVIDVATNRKVAEVGVGGQPMNVAFSPDGRRAFVTNRLDDSLSVIDTATRAVVATVPVGDEPHGVAIDANGSTIYVLNTSSDDISVIDAASLREAKRLSAGRGPWAIALAPDGSRMIVTNALSQFV